MRILLVEPDYRRKPAGLCGNKNKSRKVSDESLWYPPIGLMKLARYHKTRGDYVRFVSGIDANVIPDDDLFKTSDIWDRVYITTLFTFHFDKVIKTIQFYKSAVGGTTSKIYVGGIMASLMPNDIFEATGVTPILGLLYSSKQLGFSDDVNIDKLTPDYTILNKSDYAVNETFYTYTTKGCSNNCPWCGVPIIEPTYESYLDIKSTISQMRKEYGDFYKLKLMDNNVLASSSLQSIVDDLVKLGYGRGEITRDGKRRVIDFNQGTDASHINEDSIKHLSRLNISPLRIAFDRKSEEKLYIKAVELAFNNGFNEISNYMLYNFKDSPRDLYDRIMVNIKLNEKWKTPDENGISGQIYCYPMRYAPIDNSLGRFANHSRDYFKDVSSSECNWLTNPVWNKRFIRNIEVIKGAANGAIPTTAGLARRAIGRTFEEFITNLYMPEHMLMYRNRFEKSLYPDEPKRKEGDGRIEEFRSFMTELLKSQDKRFYYFHNAVSERSLIKIREAIEKKTLDKEMKRWLSIYLEKQ